MRKLILLLMIFTFAVSFSQTRTTQIRVVTPPINLSPSGTDLDSYLIAIDNFAGTGFVDLTTNQTVGGIKTFTQPVKGVNPVLDTEFVTKGYGDLNYLGAGSTNLTYTPSTRLLESDTGTDVTLPLATSTDSGFIESYSSTTWTPVITAGGYTYTFNTIESSYTKIGQNIYFVDIYLTSVNVLATGSSGELILTLPPAFIGSNNHGIVFCEIMLNNTNGNSPISNAAVVSNQAFKFRDYVNLSFPNVRSVTFVNGIIRISGYISSGSQN